MAQALVVPESLLIQPSAECCRSGEGDHVSRRRLAALLGAPVLCLALAWVVGGAVLDSPPADVGGVVVVDPAAEPPATSAPTTPTAPSAQPTAPSAQPAGPTGATKVPVVPAPPAGDDDDDDDGTSDADDDADDADDDDTDG